MCRFLTCLSLCQIWGIFGIFGKCSKVILLKWLTCQPVMATFRRSPCEPPRVLPCAQSTCLWCHLRCRWPPWNLEQQFRRPNLVPCSYFVVFFTCGDRIQSQGETFGETGGWENGCTLLTARKSDVAAAVCVCALTLWRRTSPRWPLFWGCCRHTSKTRGRPWFMHH